MTKSQSLRADFAGAVTRLEEALALPKDPIVRDSAIQRFEISFELMLEISKSVSRRAAQRLLHLTPDLFSRGIQATTIRSGSICRFCAITPSIPIISNLPITYIRGSPKRRTAFAPSSRLRRSKVVRSIIRSGCVGCRRPRESGAQGNRKIARPWFPAFAGMTNQYDVNRSRSRLKPVRRAAPLLL